MVIQVKSDLKIFYISEFSKVNNFLRCAAAVGG